MASDPQNFNTQVADYELWSLAHREKELPKTSRFMTLSVCFHATALLLVGVFATPLMQEVKTETVTIELNEPEPLKISKGVDTPETQGSSTPATTPTSPTVAAKAPHAKSNLKAVPMTIDDIKAPELDKGSFSAIPSQGSDLDEDLSKDFAEADQKNADDLENEKRDMDRLAALASQSHQKEIQDLTDRSQAEEAQLAEAQDKLRKENAAAVASALAAERAAKESQGHQVHSKNPSHGLGAGSNGDPTVPSETLAGVPTGVRSLDQLRQMPGNPRPQYEREERRRGDQGRVAFIAYINKEGYVSQFKMIQSTGFRNLDRKTLAALKKWRFYPGQEGWAEIPFQWDLKGGTQEDGGLLRRAVSSR